VDVGEGHTVVLSEFGEVYSWGRNFEGQLGHGHRRRDVALNSVPRRVKALENENVVAVSCGDFHSTV
jgi:alpha-tubulin suppressor-like RCC1 family protein